MVGSPNPSARERRQCAIGFTQPELISVLAAAVVLFSLVITSLGSVKSPSRVDQSLANLRTLFAAHQAYANDWAGRQVTFAIDGLAAHLGPQVFTLPNNAIHAPILVGWHCESMPTNQSAYVMTFVSNRDLVFPLRAHNRIGSFQLTNSKILHDYVNGRVYDPTYYAPADEIAMRAVAHLFDQPCEFVSSVSVAWSSYIFSPAAFFHPAVLDRSNPQYPTNTPMFPEALQAPALSQARYPDLKTHLIEHHWLQNAPIWCNPNLPNGGPYSPTCQPYYFNHAIASEPASVFYDGHTRRLPNVESMAADAIVEQQLQSVDGLWFSNGGALKVTNLTEDGYYESIGFDQVEIRHTMLTIDGILGRDTLGSQ